jgi:DNA-binding MarR family transcriptional regulator
MQRDRWQACWIDLAHARLGVHVLRMTLSRDALDRLRFDNLGRLLDEAHLRFDQAALGYLRSRGYPWLNASHVHVMRTMQRDGASITAMAAQAFISKQAMSKLVMQFRERGLLRVEADPMDGRNLKVVTTEGGRELLAHGVAALQQAEDDLAERIGRDELERLRRILRRIRDESHRVDLAHPAGGRRRRPA